METLANLLKNHRKKSGLTQKELGIRINFNHTVISRAENPASNYLPTRAYIQQFCASLPLNDLETSELTQAYELAIEQRNPHQTENEPADPPAPVTGPLPTTNSPARTASANARNIEQWSVLLGVAGIFTILGLYILLNKPVFAKIPNPIPVTMMIATPDLPSLTETIASPDPTATSGVSSSSSTVLYSDNFESRSISDWEEFNTGKWQIFDSAGSSVFGVIQPNPKWVPNAFLTQSMNWVDYDVNIDMKFKSGVYEQIFLVVRNGGRKDNCSGYRIGGNRLGVSIFRFENKGDCLGNLLDENMDVRLVSEQSYTLRVEVQGPTIRAFIDNQLVLHASDSHYPTGGIGLLAYQVQWAGFDNLQVNKR